MFTCIPDLRSVSGLRKRRGTHRVDACEIDVLRALHERPHDLVVGGDDEVSLRTQSVEPAKLVTSGRGMWMCQRLTRECTLPKRAMSTGCQDHRIELPSASAPRFAMVSINCLLRSKLLDHNNNKPVLLLITPLEPAGIWGKKEVSITKLLNTLP